MIRYFRHQVCQETTAAVGKDDFGETSLDVGPRHSNHELDKIQKSRNLLIRRSHRSHQKAPKAVDRYKIGTKIRLNNRQRVFYSPLHDFVQMSPF